jgi:hypothetical protein
MNRPLARRAAPIPATAGLLLTTAVAAPQGQNTSESPGTVLRLEPVEATTTRWPSAHGSFPPAWYSARRHSSCRRPSAASALKTAGAILSRADLDATWVVCTPARDRKPQPGCDTSPASHEVVVRLTRSGPGDETGNSRAFGSSLIDPTTATGTLSTVFVDRVDWLAATGKAVRADVLGRAIAHEIGHQLLGSNDHSPRGLMRETWTPDELTRNRADDWQFSTAQRAALHARWASWGLGRRAGTRDPRAVFGS